MQPTVSGKELFAAVRDLEKQLPIKGFTKIALASLSLATPASLAMTASSSGMFITWAILSAIAYTYALIPTHDAIHYTLTGYKWVDELYSRLISYPIFWTHGTYSELHKLHHKMNGIEGKDPERKNPTEKEYFHPNLILRFYYRNRFLIDTFVFAGLGLIFINIRDGLRFGKKAKSIRRAVYIDLLFIAAVHITFIFSLGPYGLVGKFYIMLLIWERIAGGILHFRAHIEHDSLEPAGSNYYEIQMSACRNIMTSEVVSRYFNRLTHHSMHHAFPKIPFYNLPEAHQRIKKLLPNQTQQLPEHTSYIAAATFLLKNHNYYRMNEKDKLEAVTWVKS